MSLLGELRAAFPAFPGAAIRDGEYAPLLAGLGIPGTLALASADGWTERDGEIRLDGSVSTPVLGVANAPIAITFAPSGQDYALTLVVTLPVAWTPAQSFAALAGTTLADLQLDAQHPATLSVSSAGGLAFDGTFAAGSSTIAEFAWLLDGGATLTVSGPLRYDARTGALEMALPLARAGLEQPALRFEIDLWSGTDARTGHHAAGVRFATTLDLGRTITLEALLHTPEQGILDLLVTGSAFAFPEPSALVRYFGAGNGIASALPEQFSGGTLVEVSSLMLGIGLGSRTLEYALLVVSALPGQTWKVWPGVIEVDDPHFVFQIFQPLAAHSVSAFSFSAIVTLGETVPLLVTAQLPAETLTIGLDRRRPPPNLAAFIKHLFGETFAFGEDLWIAQLELSADVQAGAYWGTIEVAGALEYAFGDDHTITFEDLTIDLAYDEEQGASGDVSARFAVGANEFAISFAMTKANTVFKGVWTAGEEPLTYQAIAFALGLYGLPALPEALQLALAEASFEFDSAGPSFMFELTTAAGGGAALIAGKDPETDRWGFVYGMILSLDVKVDLADIDVVGQLVPPGEGTIELSELRIVGANTARPSVELTDQQKTILGPEVTRGLALSVLLAVGTEFREPLSIRFGGADDASEDDTPPSTEGKLLAFAGDVPAAPQATWITIQRAFGPVQFERVGFAFTEQAELALLLDGSVSLAGLTIVLVGLEAAMPLKAPYEPAFGLAGLQVSFEGGGVEIAGGLEKIPGREPAAYTGDLIVKAAGFGLTALGSYTTVGGDPSLFAFLFLDAPLGGPPFFFVTGVAGGFGYNRSLALPGIEGVADFPLVAGATGKLDAKQTQQQLDERIVPALGQNWLAAGVRFTSFEMVSSFALLTIAFGTHTEIALLGEATISVPAAALGEEVTPTAEAQMVLLVDVDPDSGQLAVSAQLTPNSYVLSRAAKLTGGFGFYTWFGKSPHAGDFVITLGGYNPYFTAPDHYPKPPRLGLDWKLPGNLEIKGGLYFALTPSVVMAGGSLEATWTSGSLRAWFDAQADFLIRFKPFSYRIDVKISIGVSLTLDFGFTTKVITVHVGVELSLYGPPFGGVATIDLWIVSFTIEFGGEPLPAPDLSWTQFRQSFLPAVGVVTLAAAQGLLGRHEEVWLVDPAHLRIEVATQVPATDASVNRVQPAGDWNRQLGIGPMGAKPGTLAGALEITLERTEGEQDSWHASAVTGKAPAGLWHNTTNVMDGPALVEDVMNGVAVVPAPPEGGHTRPVPLAALAAADPAVRACRWSAATAPHGDSFDQDRALAVLGETLADPAVAATRDALLAALRAQGLTTAESVDVGDLAAGAGDVLTDPPQLRSLGEVVPG